MYAGIAGALLIFTGIWHATEFMMGGKNKDTLQLVPAGIIYVILGCLIVTLTGGTIVQTSALILTVIGMSGGIYIRNTTSVRKWVLSTFILIDFMIILCLGIALLA